MSAEPVHHGGFPVEPRVSQREPSAPAVGIADVLLPWLLWGAADPDLRNRGMESVLKTAPIPPHAQHWVRDLVIREWVRCGDEVHALAMSIALLRYARHVARTGRVTEQELRFGVSREMAGLVADHEFDELTVRVQELAAALHGTET